MQNIIKVLRTKKGMTQEELGEYLGVKKSAIQKYESGAIINLKADTIRKLCSLFDVAPDLLLFHNETKRDFLPETYMTMRRKFKKSPQYEIILHEATFLNEEGLKKVNDYIQDIKRIGEFLK